MAKLYEEHADLCDLAFDWDVGEEAEWLHTRLGSSCRSVLEPGCGSGRFVEALARRGLSVVGLDRSPAMVEIGRKRMLRSGLRAEVIRADMRHFMLGRVFDGAVCPINTLAHLTPSELARHLDRMAEHLRPGSRYLVQLDLHETDDSRELRPSRWEVERGGIKLRLTWATEQIDVEAGRQRQRSRIEILAGERAGEVVEEVHDMTVWTPGRWAALIEGSGFAVGAVYDGDRDERPRVEAARAGRLLWHELTRGLRGPRLVSVRGPRRPR